LFARPRRPPPFPSTTLFRSSEVIRWTSRDGTTIEGVLRKPAGFRPGRPRPLLVVVHGGPAAVSRPTLFAATYVYPIEHWLAKGRSEEHTSELQSPDHLVCRL